MPDTSDVATVLFKLIIEEISFPPKFSALNDLSSLNFSSPSIPYLERTNSSY